MKTILKTWLWLFMVGEIVSYSQVGFCQTSVARVKPEKKTIGIILDSSGSMEQNDPYDIRKEGVRLILNELTNDIDIFLIEFDDEAVWLNADNYTLWNRNRLMSCLSLIDSDGLTDVGVGLNVMKSALKRTGRDKTDAAVLLLSDGLGDYNGEAEYFKTQGIPVFTISLVGDENANLLMDIAAGTGGEYMKAYNSKQILELFHRFYAIISGNELVFETSGILLPKQFKAFEFQIEEGVKAMISLIEWSKDPIALSLTSPDGRQYASKDASGTFSIHNGYAIGRISGVSAGTWKIRVQGDHLNLTGEPFLIKTYVESTPKISMNLLTDLNSFKGTALDFSFKYANDIQIETLETTVQTPGNLEMPVKASADKTGYQYLPGAGEGNYTFKAVVKGKTLSGSKFQRIIKKTVFIGDFIPPNRGKIQSIFSDIIISDLGKNVGNATGVACRIYSGSLLMAEGYVTSVGKKDCQIRITMHHRQGKITADDIVELDMTAWQQD